MENGKKRLNEWYDDIPEIEFECTCVGITLDEFDRLMKGRKRYPYGKMLKAIKKTYPELYDDMGLQFPNPWSKDTYITPTHLIMTHSGIEYFFRIVNRGLYENKKEKLKRIINEELTKAEVRGMISDKLDSYMDTKEFKRAVNNIVADTIDDFFQGIWQRKNFWKNIIKKH